MTHGFACKFKPKLNEAFTLPAPAAWRKRQRCAGPRRGWAVRAGTGDAAPFQL